MVFSALDFNPGSLETIFIMFLFQNVSIWVIEGTNALANIITVHSNKQHFPLFRIILDSSKQNKLMIFQKKIFKRQFYLVLFEIF